MNASGQDPVFRPEEAFFIIDSAHPEKVRPRLYGYFLRDTDIVTGEEYERNPAYKTGFSDIPGREGAFVLVEAVGDEIRISQDRLGTWGLYLFMRCDRVILSNSFLRLAEYLRDQGEEYTLDVRYFRHMLSQRFAVLSFDRTPLQEVRILDRRTVVRIHTLTGDISFDRLAFDENTVRLSSEEGIELVDAWVARWIRLIRRLYAGDAGIRMDLSGGFDTRLLLLLFLLSGVDLRRVTVYSEAGRLAWQQEDRRIAGILAERYGFTLADPDAARPPVLYGEQASRDITEYVKADVHLQLREYRQSFFSERLYAFEAYAGETIRGGCPTVKGLLRDMLVFLMFPLEDTASRFAYAHSALLMRRGRGIGLRTQWLRRKDMTSCRAWLYTESVRAVEHATGVKAGNRAFRHLFDRETFRRWHCGKNMVEQLFTNTIPLEPMYDAGLWKLRLGDRLCRDEGLLYAVIVDRYCPELLEYPFQGGRRILPSTLKKAARINRRFPLKGETGTFRTLPRDSGHPVIGTERGDREVGKTDTAEAREERDDHGIEETLLREFTTAEVKAEICGLFGSFEYRRILKDCRTRTRYPLTCVTPALLAVRLKRMGAKL